MARTVLRKNLYSFLHNVCLLGLCKRLASGFSKRLQSVCWSVHLSLSHLSPCANSILLTQSCHLHLPRLQVQGAGSTVD